MNRDPFDHPRFAKRWVAWRYAKNKGKEKKLPFDRYGNPARPNDPTTWTTRERAEAVDPSAGVGIMFGDCGDGETLAGVDLDSCRDPRTGRLTPWAERIVDELSTYTEISPSKAGVKAFFLVRTEDGLRGGKFIKEGWRGEQHPPAIEVYTSGRFFTVTCDAIDDAPLRKIDADLFHWLIEQGRKLEGRGAPRESSDDLATVVAMKPKGFTPEAIGYIAAHIPAENNYDPWLHVGMALHHEYAGSGDGLELWDALCVDLPDYDRDEIDRKWRSFGPRKNPRTILSLLRDAREHPKWSEDEYLRLNGGRDLDEEGADRSDAPSAIIARRYEEEDWRQIPPRQFLYGRAYTRGTVSATAAAGGAGKSALFVSEALAMASGKPLLGVDPGKPKRVWSWNLEDSREEMRRRFGAARAHFELEQGDLGDRLYLNGAEDSLVLGRVVRERVQPSTREVRQIIEQVRELGIDVLQIDPFVSAHQVPESSNDHIDALIKGTLATIARECNISVSINHHTRKPERGQGFDVHDMRGAGALANACRHVRIVNGMSEGEANTFGIAPGDRWRYFRVDAGKANLSPPGAAEWYRLASQSLENDTAETRAQDVIGVVTAWAPPDLSKTSRGERERVLEAIGARAWRQNVQADNWAGVAFAAALGLDLDDPTQKAAIKAKVKAAIKAGWLEAFDEDVGGKSRPMVRAKPRRRPSITEMLGP